VYVNVTHLIISAADIREALDKLRVDSINPVKGKYRFFAIDSGIGDVLCDEQAADVVSFLVLRVHAELADVDVLEIIWLVE